MLITYPNPILKKKAALIKDPKSPEIKALVLDMLQIMEENNGLGIAAPQVGQSLRLCAIKFEDKKYILINPRFKSRSFRKEINEEGCLSFPGKFIPVKRSRNVCVEYTDELGQKIRLKANGLLGRALQHEIDHLDGILFIDRQVSSSPKN